MERSALASARTHVELDPAARDTTVDAPPSVAIPMVQLTQFCHSAGPQNPYRIVEFGALCSNVKARIRVAAFKHAPDAPRQPANALASRGALTVMNRRADGRSVTRRIADLCGSFDG